jgi:hypothetical protein
LIVLRRKLKGRVRLTNNDRWFLIQLRLASRAAAATPRKRLGSERALNGLLAGFFPSLPQALDYLLRTGLFH